MALELRQSLKMTQQLVMTPQLQQAIKLLQLSRLELAATIQQEVEQNPLLEDEGPAPDHEENEHNPATADPDLPTAADKIEKTAEVDVENNSSLKEIDWQDYANEYEPAPSFKSQADSNDLPSRLDILVKKPDLQSHLQWQLSLANFSPAEETIGQFIIGNLNRDGFLKMDTDDICEHIDCPSELAIKMISAVQEMDPPGVGARSVKESLLLQLNRLELSNSLAATIVRDFLGQLEKRNYGAIVKGSGRSQAAVLEGINIITGLDPYPGRAYSDEEPQYIVPDVYVYKMDEEYVILLNDEGLPRLRISAFYKEMLSKNANTPGQTVDYIQGKMKSAAWLIKSIQQRQRTIYRVVESIIKFQKEFFEKGVFHLRPMILRDVAEDIEMHESTISRVTNNKYVHTPQGTFELKYFFNSAIERKDGGDAHSSETIKNRLRQFVQNEDQYKPLSDNAIAEAFKREDIKLARRTVAKYREQLGILPSKMRRKPKF